MRKDNSDLAFIECVGIASTVTAVIEMSVYLTVTHKQLESSSTYSRRSLVFAEIQKVHPQLKALNKRGIVTGNVKGCLDICRSSLNCKCQTKVGWLKSLISAVSWLNAHLPMCMHHRLAFSYGYCTTEFTLTSLIPNDMQF